MSATKPLDNPTITKIPKKRQTSPYPQREGVTTSVPGAGSFIPRRWQKDFGAIVTRATITRMANESPLRLLTHLPDINPAVGFSVWQKLRLAIPADGLEIVGVKNTAISNSSPGKTNKKPKPQEKDAEATEIINNLFASLPQEVGGLQGLQTTLMLLTLTTGTAALEAVPSQEILDGVARIWPVDPLTLYYSRPTRNDDITVFQRQSGGTMTGYEPLSNETFFYRGLDMFADDPHGRSPYFPVIPEILVEMAMVQDMRDSVHANAWPRKVIPFNFEKAYETAKTVYGEHDLNKAKKWVDARFKQIVSYINQMNPDDDMVVDSSGGTPSVLQSGNYNGINHIIDFFTRRILWAMKDLPLMMGVNDATSETYATVQFTQYINGLETIRSIFMYPLLAACDLHFRLLGLPYRAKPNYKKLRMADVLAQTQVEMQQILNSEMKVAAGMISEEEGAIEVTGHGPTGKRIVPQVTAGGGPAAAGQNPGGVTQEEQKAQQNAQRTAQRSATKDASIT